MCIRDRADTHDGGIAADRTEGADLCQRLEAVCTDVILRSDDHSSAGVVDAGSVTSGNGAVLLECGSQLSQTLEGGVGTAVLDVYKRQPGYRVMPACASATRAPPPIPPQISASTPWACRKPASAP